MRVGRAGRRRQAAERGEPQIDQTNGRKVRAKRGSTLTNQIWPTSKKGGREGGRKEGRKEGRKGRIGIAKSPQLPENPHHALSVLRSALEKKRYSA